MIMKQTATQSGNAFLYVLIAVVLFAALSFVLGRQTSDTSEAGTLAVDRTAMAATQIMAYSASVKGIVDQMTATGSLPENLTFEKPSAAGYGTGPYIDKVYHPEGGGLVDKALPAAFAANLTNDPPAGWHLGRFNNVEWTPSTAPDILVTAFQITRPVCEAINRTLTGAATIPTLGAAARDLLVDDADHGGTNADLTVAACAACEGLPSLCVKDSTQDIYAYYSVIVGR